MLKHLRLTNIVLIEMTEISFSPGFNVLSGESGSGKSAILNALNLIAGERSDVSIVRRGAEKGIVEAVFDIDILMAIPKFLEEAGIDHEIGNELLVRREIFISGKSRAFINNQAVQVGFLKKLSEFLFEVVGQHANQKLLSLDYHQQTLDLFGNLQDDAATFYNCWNEESAVRRELERLTSSEAQRLRDSEVCRMEIEELEEANLKDGEEETLFAEYSLLSNADDLVQKVSEINRILNGDKIAVLSHLSRQKLLFDQLVEMDPALKETATSYQNALLELQEVAHTLRIYENRIESNPAKILQLNERLSLINRLKRKFGTSINEIHAYLKATKEKLFSLENADANIELLQSKLKMLEEQCNAHSESLTNKRIKIAKELEISVVQHLRVLNMPKVEFIIKISPQKRCRIGDDKIEFFLIPNVGEHCVSLRECASGGELSRIMLALQALLAGKEQIPTLVFDEVDANIGGETAGVVGEKLLEIGAKHQVLCITHFPQVAKLAKHHLQIFKQEIDGRTVTHVKSLDKETRKKELARMLGKS
ncbi:MAG: DNA repair protein RecN [Parachlamydiaceae bacterium]|nr:DNA repair protein RecN [Parachlamydiaceae bacterium]